MIAAIRLLDAGDQDLEFLYGVYADSRADELSAVPWPPEAIDAFLRMQFHAQHTYYRQHYGDAQYSIVLHREEPIGRLYVHRGEATLTLIDIALLRRHRGQGVGSALLAELLAEAEASNKRVRLHVEQENQAFGWYKRLGFRHIGEFGVYFEMEWTPGLR